MVFKKGHKDLVPKEARERASEKMIGNNFGFKKGFAPWNKGEKTSEKTKKKQSEAKIKFYKEGGIHWNYIDGRSKNIKAVKFIKGIRESHLNYCKSNRMHYIPKGFVIHHLDTNPMNNEPNNLILMQQGDHLSLHSKINRLVVRSLKNV